MIEFNKGPKNPTKTPDSLVTDDTVEVLLALGEGPIKGTSGPQDVFLDDTPLVSQEGVSNFSNFALDFWPGAETGHVVEMLLGGASSPTSIQQTLLYNVPVTREGLQVNINAIDVRLIVQRLAGSDAKGNTFKQPLSVKIEIKRVSESTWRPAWYSEASAPGTVTYTPGGGAGDSDTWTSTPGDVLTRLTPGADSADTFDFAFGYGSGPPLSLPLSTTVTNKYIDSTDLAGVYTFRTSDMTWVRTSLTPGAAGPDGRFFYNTSTTPPSPTEGDLWMPTAGNLYVFNGLAFVAPGEYYDDPPLGLNQTGVWSITEKTTSNTAKDLRIFVEPVNEHYQLRVTKLVPNSTEEIFTDVSWESIQEIVRGPIAFTGVSTMKILGRASDQFTGVPNVSSVNDGRIVKVPTNYNPTTRAYTGVWDGTYKLEYTNCTAWVLQDFIENDVYGLSSIFPHTVNKWKFYEFGQFCDEMVLRPDGGTRPRWTFNDYITEARDGSELCQYIAASAGARVIDDGNGYCDLIIDRADNPAVMLFTPENVSPDGFEYTYTDRYSRSNEVIVEFVNPNLNWLPDKRRLTDDADIEAYGRITDNFIAVGCTDVDEAKARGRRRLIGGLTEKELVGFKTNRQGKYLNLFDVILIADPKMGRGLTGRIQSQTNSTTVVLREPVTLEPGITYKLTFNKVGAAAIETREVTVTSAAGTRTTLVFTPAVADLTDNINFTLHAGTIGLPKPFIVMGIEDGGGDGEMITISGRELNRNKQAFIDEGGEVDEVDYDQIDFYSVEPVPSAQALATANGGAWLITLTYEPSPSRGVRGYEVEHYFNDTLINTSQITGLSLEVPGAAEGSHLFVVRAISAMGRKSRPGSTGLNLVGVSRVIPAPTNPRVVGATVVSGNWQLKTLEPVLEWDGATFPAFSHYLVTAGGVEIDVGATPRWAWLSAQQVGASRVTTISIQTVNMLGERSSAVPIVLENKAPTAPTITLVPSTAGITVNISAAVEADVVGARIIVATTTGGAGTAYDVTQTSTLIPLDDYSTRFIRVAYFDDYGQTGLNWSAESSAARQVVTPSDLDSTPPANVATPTMSIATTIAADGAEVSFLSGSWTAVADAAGYDIDIDDGVGGGWTESSPVASLKNVRIKTGLTYKIQVKAFGRTGLRSVAWSAWSATAAAGGDTTAPGQVTGGALTPYARRIVVSWSPPTDDDFSHVVLYRDTDGTLAAPDVWYVSGSSYADTAVTAGTLYYYWTRSVDRTGNMGSFTYIGSSTPTFVSVGGGDVLSTDPVLVTGYGTAGAYTGQTPWGTYTGRSVDALNAAIFSDGYLQSGLNARVGPREMMGGIAGTNLALNPEFADGSAANYGVYNNAGGTKVTHTIEYESNAPNSSRYVLKVSYDGTGTPNSNPEPGFGGVYQGLTYTTGAARPGQYTLNSRILYKVMALIPVGRTLMWHGNARGADSTVTSLTSMEGTGSWQLYIFEVFTGGPGGSPASIGHLAVHGGANTAFHWYLARYDQIDTSGPAATFINTGLRDSSGARRGDADLITVQGTAASITGQAPWATLGTSTGRLNYLNDSGELSDLTRVVSRPMTALTARTADNITYVSGGVTVDSLRPGEAGANVTEGRVAASITGQAATATSSDFAVVTGPTRPSNNATVGARSGTNLFRDDGTTVLSQAEVRTNEGVAASITGQTDWATYGTLTPAQVATPVTTFLTPRTQSSSVVAAGGARWHRVARVVSSDGRGAMRVTLGFNGGGAAPSALVLDVSRDWGDNGTISIVSNGVGCPITQARLSRGTGESYLDVYIGANSAFDMMISVEPMPGTQGVWAVHYVDTPTVGATLIGTIPLTDVSGANRVLGVMTNGTYTLVSAAGGVNTNGVAAVNSSGVSFDVTHGADRAVLERGANITETRTASAITGQAATATSSDFSVVTGPTRPSNNATVGARSGTNLFRTDGTTVLSQAEVRTNEGVAASITGQAATATSADFSAVTGATRPANNATVGARSGTNLFRDDGASVMWQSEVRTSEGVSASVTGQTDWATYTGRSVGALNSAIFSDGYIQSGLNTHFRPDMMMNGAVGTQLAVDPEFHQAWPPAGSGLYDNSGGGKTTITRVVAPAAPNSSSYQLTITYNGTGTPGSNPSPGFGGIYQGLEYAGDGNPSRPNRYAKFTKILYKIWAHIPVGRTLQTAANSFGDQGYATWLTSQNGTGDWALYELIYNIGWSGSFSSIGHMYVGDGPNTAFSWHIAKYEQIDITSATSAFTGNLRRVNNGAVLSDATLVTSDGTAGAIMGQTAWATSALPTGRLNNLSDAGVFNNLSNITTRPLDALTGRTADKLTYIGGGGPTMEVMRPMEGGANVTETRTASAITGQAATATSSDFSAVTGATRPSNNATVGARSGTNLFRDDGASVMWQSEVRTSEGVAATVSGQGPGATAVSNRVLNDRYEGGVKLIQQPDGGQYNNPVSNQAGQLEIVLPFAWNVASPMITFDVMVHDYSTGRTSTYTIAGHHYNTGSYGWWQNVTATFNGPRSFSRPVRFGFNAAGKATIWIGSVNDLWQYPNVTIRNVQIGYSAQALDWATGWTVGLNNTAISGTYVNMTTPYWVQIVDVPRSGDQVFGEGLLEVAGGAVATRPNFRTDQGVASSISGQGSLATTNTISSDNQLGGSLALRLTPYGPDNNYLSAGRVVYANSYGVESLRPGEAGANITESRTASAITGQTRFATASSLSTADGDIAAPWSAIDSRPATTQGNALTEDAACADPSSWILNGGGSFVTVNDGQVARTAYRGTSGNMFGARMVPVDASKTYMMEGWYRSVGGGTTTCYGLTDLQDGSGNTISADGTYWAYEPSGATIPTTWTYFSRIFGAGTGKPIPSNARQMRTGMYPNYGGSANSTEVQGLRIVEVTRIGANLYMPNGNLATQGDVVTSSGVAASITGQAATATSADFSAVTGATRPANNATVGARSGTNLFRDDGASVMWQSEVRTSEGVAASISGQAATATSSDFAAITGTTRPSANAGTSGILTALGSFTTVTGNTVGKTGGTHGAYQGGAVGAPQRGSAYIQSSIQAAVAGGGWLTHVALDDDATSFAFATSYLAAFSAGAGTGTVYLYKDGTQIGSQGSIAVTNASRLLIGYDGSSVFAEVDGVRYFSTPAPAGLRLWPKIIDFYNNGPSYPVVDVLYGAWTENTAAVAALVPYNSETVVSGSTATKVGGSHGSWGGGVSSRDRYTGSAFCSFRVAESFQPYFMAGLAAPGFGGDYNTIQYSCYTTGLPGSQAMRAYAGGIGELATLAAAGAWALTDVWSVVYDGVRVQWLQNGVVRYTYAAAAGQTLGFAASQVYIGNQLADIQVGPAPQAARIGQNTYDDTGGALVSRGGLITSLGTAASIAGQGPGATAAANRVLNDRLENSVRTIPQPDGATLNGGSSNMAGQIQIVLPFGATNTMMRFKVSIYDYEAGRTYEYILGGYNYALTSWINVSATFNGPRHMARPVKFGYWAGKAYIWIGNVGDLWQYPVVTVTEFQAGYNNQNLAWESGWSIELNNTDISGITYATVAVPRNGDQVFGEGLLEQPGGAVATRAAFRTDQGVASSFAGQTLLATQTFPTHAGIAAAKAAGLTDGRQFYDSSNSNLLTAVVSGSAGFRATASNTSRIGSRSGAGSVTTSTVTITPTGAGGAVSYNWYFIGGDSSISITAATSAATAFTGSVSSGETKTATFACAVTDAGTGSTITLICTATLTETS